MSDFQVIARNHAETSENRIHSDEVAQKLGFTGALVPGVAVYGYMVQPLIDAWGEDWLAHGSGDVRFLKPAYDGDTLFVSRESTPTGLTLRCRNQHGVELAILNAQSTPRELVADRELLDGTPLSAERITIGWDSVPDTQPLSDWIWTVEAQENQQYADHVSDTAERYTQYVHPHWLLSQANSALTRKYVIPTWIHVGSEFVHHAPLLIGDRLTVKSAVIEKWRKKGHEFVRLLIQYLDGQNLKTEILHTAIFRVAGL